MTSRTLAKALDVVVAAKKPGAEMCFEYLWCVAGRKL